MPGPLALLALGSQARRVLDVSWRIALVFALAFVVNVLVARSIRRVTEGMRRRATDARDATSSLGRDDRLRRVDARTAAVSTMLRSLSAVTLFTLAVLVALGVLDVNLGPLLAGAGVVGVAVGFGTQSLVRDLVAGVFVLIEDQYGVGDVIDAGPATGTVERVTLRSTQLRDLSGTVWHIPNGSITSVGNKSQNWARAVIDVLVAHGTDVRTARSILRAVAESLVHDPEWGEARLVGSPDEQGVQALGPDGVTLRLVVDTEPASQWAVERELRLRIKEAFDAEGIQLSSAGTPWGGGAAPPGAPDAPA